MTRSSLAFSGLLLAVPAFGAPARAAAAPKAVRLEISPPAVRLEGKQARQRVFVTATFADGSRRDVTEQAVLKPLGPEARAVGGPVLVGARDGSGAVEVTFAGARARLPVAVSGTARERPLSFRYDVVPVLSRAGCNQGSCHGNSEGRGGFKLSLKGEDPQADFEVIARHGGGRRLNRTEPEASLLLLKPTSAVPHGGGRRFGTDSDEYRTLAVWIAQGARFDPPDAPTLASLEVLPAERISFEPARLQRLTVLAHFSDGAVRTVTEQAVYGSSDPGVEVTPDGLATASHGGDAAILVRFADQMRNARLTFVPAGRDFASDNPPVFNWIDPINYRRLRALRLRPSRLTTDAEFLRRAYLDAVGRLPTPDEARAFLDECSGQQSGVAGSGLNPQPRIAARQHLVEKLLGSQDFNDYWTLKWCDVLRVEERSLDPKGAAADRGWIRESIEQNKPLDRFVRELLTASGSTYANPPANYYRRTRTPIELGETTTQLFLGSRLLCAKCHNHPFERWKQDDFYALAAYFSRIDRKIENVTRRDQFDKHELIGEEKIGVAKEGEVEQPRTGRTMAPALPAFLLAASGVQLQEAPAPSEPSVPNAQRPTPNAAHTPILPHPHTPGSGPAQPEDRRLAFAEWLTSPRNLLFSRALVNRIWYHLVGRGIVDPVDDLRESNPPANPELLDALAKDFAAHGFDFRYLVRTIMNSRTYQLASDANGTNADDERFFSRGIAQRLPAEVLLDAISQATGVPESFDGAPAGTRAIQAQTSSFRKFNPFLRTFGQPPRESVCECERGGESTLSQSFALISGGVVDGKLKRPENRIGALIAAGKKDPEIVEELYLACVSRPPSEGERAAAGRYIAAHPDRRAALEDLLWALINSKEFLLRR